MLFRSEMLRERGLVIYSDSRAALMALDSNEVKSSIVLMAMEALDDLSQLCPVTLRWVKAHIGHEGNEEVDWYAKAATEMRIIGPEPVLPIPMNLEKKQITESMQKIWERRFATRLDCRQSKMLWPTPQPAASRRLLLLTREAFGHVIQFVTGHNFLERHRFLCGETDAPTCRLCGLDEETSAHILFSCPAPVLVEHRLRSWGRPIITQEYFSINISGVSDAQVVALLHILTQILPADYCELLRFNSVGC